MKYIEGDLIKLAYDGEFDFIAHGCNCFNTMSAGIAKQIKEQIPEAFEADKMTVEGDIDKLGNYSTAWVFNKLKRFLL